MLALVTEANLAVTELQRFLNFSTKTVKRIDPFQKFLGQGIVTKKIGGRTEVLVKVFNEEEGYYYEWPLDKFRNRVFMFRQ